MSNFFSALGIDWQLLLTQLLNFSILLMVLTFFVYKPLIKIIKARNAKIQEGLDKTAEADMRLKEIDRLAKEKMKQAEKEAMTMMQAAEIKAEALRESLSKKAQERQKMLLKQIDEEAALKKEEAEKMVLSNATELVKRAIVKTVEMDPRHVDEALIKKALTNLTHEI